MNNIKILFLNNDSIYLLSNKNHIYEYRGILRNRKHASD